MAGVFMGDKYASSLGAYDLNLGSVGMDTNPLDKEYKS